MAEKGEDLNLPNSVISRMVKETCGEHGIIIDSLVSEPNELNYHFYELSSERLPDGVSLSKEARTAIGKAASVFVLYATSCANNFAQAQKRKTLLAADVLQALEEMEFGEFVQPLKENLEAYRKEQKGKKVAAAESKRKKTETGSSDDMSPDSKKQKTAAERPDVQTAEEDSEQAEKSQTVTSKNGET